MALWAWARWGKRHAENCGAGAGGGGDRAIADWGGKARAKQVAKSWRSNTRRRPGTPCGVQGIAGGLVLIATPDTFP